MDSGLLGTDGYLLDRVGDMEAVHKDCVAFQREADDIPVVTAHDVGWVGVEIDGELRVDARCCSRHTSGLPSAAKRRAEKKRSKGIVAGQPYRRLDVPG